MVPGSRLVFNHPVAPALRAAILSGHLAGVSVLLQRDRQSCSWLYCIASGGGPAVLTLYLDFLRSSQRTIELSPLKEAAVKVILRGELAMLRLLINAALEFGYEGLGCHLLPRVTNVNAVDILPVLLSQPWYQLPPNDLLRLSLIVCIGVISGRRESTLLIFDYIQEHKLLPAISLTRLQRVLIAYRLDPSADLPVVSLLLEQLNPLHDGELLNVSAECGRLDVVRLLVGRGAPVQYEFNDPLVRAVKAGHAGVAAFLISRGACPLFLSTLERVKLKEWGVSEVAASGSSNA